MIYDTLDNAGRYAPLHPLFPEAFSAMRSYLATPPRAGTLTLVGDDLYAVVAEQEPGGAAFPLLEAHRKYIDIQAPIRGGFDVGWRALVRCADVRQPYDADRDCALFGGSPELTLPLAPGMFAVFFPDDAHAPAVPGAHLLKVVLKVRIA